MKPLSRLDLSLFESPVVLRKTATAARKLAELKGLVASIPNEGILIQSLAIQEAKDSSEIENIVTTHDELFRVDTSPDAVLSPAAKEVRDYVQALRTGYSLVAKNKIFTTNHIIEIQSRLVHNQAGLRNVPGTTLKGLDGTVVYTPPQDGQEIRALMTDLEHFINDDDAIDVDPLIKMAIIHHQFESIHPFYDGNGRTGRIMNVLYLMQKGLLGVPVLYLSSAIMRTKRDYYRLLQAVRDSSDGAREWEAWVLYMLNAVERTAAHSIATVTEIKVALADYKKRIRDQFKFYSQDLINNLFTNPYTKIDLIERDLGVSRLTASKYLGELAAEGFLQKKKAGRANYFVNVALMRILTRPFRA